MHRIAAGITRTVCLLGIIQVIFVKLTSTQYIIYTTALWYFARSGDIGIDATSARYTIQVHLWSKSTTSKVAAAYDSISEDANFYPSAGNSHWVGFSIRKNDVNKIKTKQNSSRSKRK